MTTQQDKDVHWIATKTGLVGKMKSLTITIEKNLPIHAFTADRKVVGFSAPRYKAFVEEALVDTEKVFFDTLEEAKQNAIDLATSVLRTVEANRAKRRAAMLQKFGLTEE